MGPRTITPRFGRKILRDSDGLIRFFRREFPGPNWCFRGHADATWPLTSSLERYCSDFGFARRKMSRVEQSLLLDFCRTVAVHAAEVPSTSDPQDLLALMQHHGTPTRLLDWSYSPFIAMYFALETAKGPAAVWALNGDWIEREADRVVRSVAPQLPPPSEYAERRDGETFFKLFMPQHLKTPQRPARFVYTVNPRVLNTRLTIQQGVFTAVGDVSKSFAENLVLFRDVRNNLVRVVIPRRVGRDILRVLYRMGISRASLYPGVDGFAWSLRTKWHTLRDITSVIRQWPY